MAVKGNQPELLATVEVAEGVGRAGVRRRVHRLPDERAGRIWVDHAVYKF